MTPRLPELSDVDAIGSALIAIGYIAATFYILSALFVGGQAV